MFYKYLIPIIFIAFTTMNAQELPFKEIPDAPETYTSGNIIARMIDGLGYRYYWATEGLTKEDLAYKPTKESRSLIETLQHVYGMSEMILESEKAEPSIRPKDFTVYSFEELRRKTLKNLEVASIYAKGKTATDVSNFKITYQRGDKKTEFPYWNMLNGMLSDCIYHTGQIVLLRRSNGNPMNPNVNVFTGKTRG